MNLLDNTDQNDQVQIDPNKNYLEELVGEGRKFKSVEELARGKAESDLYIEHMKRQSDELRTDYVKLRDEYNTGPKLKEVLDQLAELKGQRAPLLPEGGSQDTSVLDETKVADLVASMLQQSKTADREAENFRKVESKLQESYGSDYKRLLKQKVSELGLEDGFVNDLAKRHPEVLFRTLGLDQARSGDNFQAPVSSSVRRDNFGTGAPQRTWSFYQKMRKDDPARYHDPKTKSQMFKDYQELGSRFEDGNWVNNN